MNVSPALLALLLSLVIGCAVAVIMPLIPDPRCQPSFGRRFAIFVIAATGAFLVLVNLSLLGPIGSAPFSLAPWPLALLATAIGLIGLYATTGSDLFYDRVVSQAVVWYPTLAILGIYALAIPTGSRPAALVMALIGALVGWGLGKAMSIPARLFARWRGAPDEVQMVAPAGSRCLICGKSAHMAKIEDPDGGPHQVEDFGSGDVWVLGLIGALLGPIGVVYMLVGATIINGLLAALLWLRDRLARRAMGSTYLPFVPGFCIATVYILLSH